MDVVALRIGDVSWLGIVMDEVYASAPPATAIALHRPCHGVAVGFVGLGDVTACHFRIIVAGFVHLFDVDATFVGLDFLHEDIQAFVVAVDHHFTELSTRGVLSDGFGKFIRQEVATSRLLISKGVEDPIVLLGHAEDADVVVRNVVVLQGLQSVRLLVGIRL